MRGRKQVFDFIFRHFIISQPELGHTPYPRWTNDTPPCFPAKKAKRTFGRVTRGARRAIAASHSVWRRRVRPLVSLRAHSSSEAASTRAAAHASVADGFESLRARTGALTGRGPPLSSAKTASTRTRWLCSSAAATPRSAALRTITNRPQVSERSTSIRRTSITPGTTSRGAAQPRRRRAIRMTSHDSSRGGR